MGNILQNLRSTVIAGFVLLIAIVVVVTAASGQNALIALDSAWWAFFFRWLHVLSGIMWIGLLYYFNFVQIPSMPKIPDEQKPAIGKVIAPTALFWFRWAALSTLVTGLILATLNGYLVSAIVIGLDGDFGGRSTAIGIGMWLGAIMAFNVWFVIWPNQKKALGLVEADADSKKKAARTAMLFSRTNTALSVPMLYAMVSAQNLF
jgi:uncharacterized membrane protein